MKKGLFITFEGPDGSGKTTVSKAVVEALQKEGHKVVYTREPGGSFIAEKIRDIILDPSHTQMDVRCEALLYAACRRQHLMDEVLPKLAQGYTVISDRFVDSSLAYQGVGRRIGIEEVYAINAFAIEDHMPDLTLFLNVSAEEGLRRIQGRQFLDRLDKEGLDFHQRVFDGYQQVVSMYPERIEVVDASKPIEDVVAYAKARIVKAMYDER